MKKILVFVLVVVLSVAFTFYGCSSNKPVETKKVEQKVVTTSSSSKLQGDGSEEFYMVTFLSGIEYWKGCYKGFEDAAKLYNVKTVYDGATEYEIDKCVKKLDEIIAKKPAGIALTCMNPEAYEKSIKKAREDGISVVCFDADSPNSERSSFLATGNYAAGVMAANHMAKLQNKTGNVMIVTLPGQLNHEQRSAGFKETIEKTYPNMKVVEVINGGAGKAKAAKATADALNKNLNVVGIFATDATSGTGVAVAVKEANKVGKIKIVSFDTDKSTLDMIKDGTIDASIAQGTWNMGFWSLQFLFQLKHKLINPVENWEQKGINPLPGYVDTGVNVVTKDNADVFYQ